MKSQLRTKLSVKIKTENDINMDIEFKKEASLKSVLKQLSQWTDQSKILLSRENITGHKLEDLAAQLQVEMQEKTDFIKNDDRPEAKAVIENNLAILDHLAQIEQLQRNSIEILAKLGPDQGPLGKPRIG